MFNPEILLRISKEVGAPVSRVETTIKLLEEGATVPFIARYRKEATGNLDEVKIRDIDESRQYYKDLENRRATVLASIEKQGKLTDELKAKILACYNRNELEDLYLPFKPKRKDKGERRAGARTGTAGQLHLGTDGNGPRRSFAQQFVNAEKEIPTLEAAIEGALHILAERIAENPEFRKQLRERLLTEGMVRAKVAQGKESEKTKYEMYYNFEETVPKIPSHRMLAIRRGTRENILTLLDRHRFREIHRQPAPAGHSRCAVAVCASPRTRGSRRVRTASPAVDSERSAIDLRERAESEAIKVFEENLRTLLLAPPAGQIGVIGIDPGQRTGCKVAVVDETGKFLENQTIYPTEPKKDLEGAEKIVLDLIQKHNVRGIAIGNGTASRETESFVRSVVEKHQLGSFRRCRQRVRRFDLFGLEASARGISESRRDGSRRNFDCAAAAGSAGGTGEDRTEIDRSRPVSARRRSEETEAQPGSARSNRA